MRCPPISTVFTESCHWNILKLWFLLNSVFPFYSNKINIYLPYYLSLSSIKRLSSPTILPYFSILFNQITKAYLNHHRWSLMRCFGSLALPLLFFYDHGEVRYIKLVEVKFRHLSEAGFDLIFLILRWGFCWGRREVEEKARSEFCEVG